MKFLLILTFALLLLPFIVQAIECGGLPEYSEKICNILNNVAGALYVIGGGIALIVVLAGGITIMTAGGGEDKLRSGKKILLFGLIGTAVLLCAGFILDLLAEFLAPMLR